MVTTSFPSGEIAGTAALEVCDSAPPTLTLMREDARQRDYPRPDLFNAIRYVVKTGC
jgi:hypothetical protein